MSISFTTGRSVVLVTSTTPSLGDWKTNCTFSELFPITLVLLPNHFISSRIQPATTSLRSSFAPLARRSVSHLSEEPPSQRNLVTQILCERDHIRDQPVFHFRTIVVEDFLGIVVCEMMNDSHHPVLSSRYDVVHQETGCPNSS